MPRFLHELFGEETNQKTLITTLVFSVVMTLFTAWLGQDHLATLRVYQLILLIILMVDIYGGIVANFSVGTSKYYMKHPVLRRIFVIIHPHAFFIFLLSGMPWLYGLYSYAFLVAASYITSRIPKRNLQELLAILFVLVGIIINFILFKQVETYIRLLSLALIIKLIYAFSVEPILLEEQLSI